MTQRSKTYNHRKRALKKYWTGYDESSSWYKDGNLRSTEKWYLNKEIEEQLINSIKLEDEE